MSKLGVLDLFSGLGGFSLGLERSGGFVTKAFCEIEEYPRKVLAKHWPDVPIYDDVRTLHVANTDNARLEKPGPHKNVTETSSKRRTHEGGSRDNGGWVTGTCTDGKPRTVGPIDVICGGFPCQDLSNAGKQAGIGEGTRSGLWSECARLLGDIRPRYAIFENVTALLSGDNGRWFEQVLWDISQVGYDAEWHCIPASELGAHHHRDRVWIVCYPQGKQCDGSGIESEISRSLRGIWQSGGANILAAFPNTNSPRLPERQLLTRIPRKAGCNNKGENPALGGWWDPESGVGHFTDGISVWLDGFGGLNEAAKERAREILQHLPDEFAEEAFQRAAGRLGGVQAAQVLLAWLYAVQTGEDTGRMEASREETEERILRVVWKHIEIACSPLRPRFNEQFSRQYSNALRELSCNTSSLYPAAWNGGFWESGTERVASGIPSRVNRLKALGNAVVPQIPEIIGRAIMEAEK